MNIVVTGASGALGRVVAEKLLERLTPEEVVLVTRRPETLREFQARGAVVRFGDFDDPDSLPSAFAGGDRMLLISTDAIGRRVAQHQAAIDAAVAAGVKRVVFTSHVNPVPDNPVGPVAHEAGETEELLQDASLEWTVLRFGSFAELQLAPAKLAIAGRRLATNSGQGRIVPVSRFDCAEAATTVLTTDGHDQTIYDITGPEALTAADLAGLFGELSGRYIRVVDIGDRTLAWMLTRFGTPKPVAQAVMSFGRAVREGYFDVVDTAFEKLCGRSPVSLREVLTPHRDELLEAA